jgi:hypothetical protein
MVVKIDTKSIKTKEFGILPGGFSLKNFLTDWGTSGEGDAGSLSNLKIPQVVINSEDKDRS